MMRENVETPSILVPPTRNVIHQILETQVIPNIPDGGAIKQGLGGYEYQMFKNGKIQIVKRNGKAYNPPLVLNQQQAVAVAKEQVALGNQGSVARDIAAGTLVFNAAAAATPPAAPGSTSPGALQAMATFLSSIASKLTVDSDRGARFELSMPLPPRD